MKWLAEKATEFFAEDASEDRKRAMRENLAALPPHASFSSVFLAHTPMRFFNAQMDAASLFADAEAKPELVNYLTGDLTHGWDIRVGGDSLRVPILLAQGRYDYVVPYTLWDGIVENLPSATLQIFERSGHQPFFEEPKRFAEVVTEWMARQS
jgi:proline iminopeptidase